MSQRFNGMYVPPPKNKFYTPFTTAFVLSKLVVTMCGNDKNYIDPTAGSGVFMSALEKLGVKDVKGFDIDPEFRDDIVKKDFKQLMPKDVEGRICVTNLPFDNKISMPILNRLYLCGCKEAFVINSSYYGMEGLINGIKLIGRFDIPRTMNYRPSNNYDKFLNVSPVMTSFFHYKMRG